MFRLRIFKNRLEKRTTNNNENVINKHLHLRKPKEKTAMDSMT